MAALKCALAAMVLGHASTGRAEPKGQLMSFALPAKTLLQEMGANASSDQKETMGQMSAAAYSLASLLQNANATGIEFRGAKAANVQFYPDDSELSQLPTSPTSPTSQAVRSPQPLAFGREIIAEGRPWFVVKFESRQRSNETESGSSAAPSTIAQGMLCGTASGLNCIQAPSETSGNETRFRWTENGEIQSWKLVLNGSPCDDFSKCQIVSSSWSRQLRLEGLRRGTGLSLSPNQVALSNGNTLSLLDLDTRKTWASMTLPSQAFNEPLLNAIGYGNGQVLLEWSKLRILLDFANDSCLVLNGTNLLRCRQGLASVLKSHALHEAGAPASNLASLFDFHGSEVPKSSDAIALSSEGVIYGRTVYSLATRQRTELEASPARVIASLDGKALRLVAVIPSPQGDRLALRQLFNPGRAAATSFPDTDIQLPQGFAEWTLLFSKKSSLFITSQGVFQLQNGRLLPTSIALSHDAVSFLPESGGAFIRRGLGSSCRWHHVRQHTSFENAFSESGAAIGCDGRVQFNASYGAVFATRITSSELQISATQLLP
jgi:hypothetical protein